jgi:hypothetical protein
MLFTCFSHGVPDDAVSPFADGQTDRVQRRSRILDGIMLDPRVQHFPEGEGGGWKVNYNFLEYIF